MSLHAGNILKINIILNPRKTILEYIRKYLKNLAKKPLVIVTPNPEQIVYAYRDRSFAKILNQADVAIPDGTGLAYFLGVARVPGIEFMEDLVSMAAKEGSRIGLIGGRDGVAVNALECLTNKYPGLRGWAFEPEDISLEKIVEKIQKTNTRMVFVGLGAPKQEYFIDALRHRLSTGCILMSVGGSFDIISGKIQRAPVLIRSIGFEWAWRLFHEPWRFRRQLAIIEFIWLVIKEKIFC